MKKRKTKDRGNESNEVLLDRINRMEAMLKETNMPLQQQDSVDDSQHILAAEGLQMMASTRHDQQTPQQPPSPPQTDPSHQSVICTTPDITYSDMSYQRNSHTPVASNDLGRRNQMFGAAPIQRSQDQAIACVLIERSAETKDALALSGEVPRESNIIYDVEQGMKSVPDAYTDRSVNCIYSPENSDWEYHGPGTFLSLCSKPSMDWVAERTGSTDFFQIAKNFSRSTTKPLKLDQKITAERAPEPDIATAFRYSKLFFEKFPDISYNIVIRSQFEARLKAFYNPNSGISRQDEGASWYALRHCIYAHGARFELGQGGYSANYTRAQVAGWQYFENAMSKYTELCFCRTGLTAVQALLCMVCPIFSIFVAINC